MKRSVAIATFGCKLNQYESQLMMESLSSDYEIRAFNQYCDIYIINSCAVTSKAAKESRNAAKAALKRNPDAMVFYTGCDVYIEERLPDNVYLIGNSYKNNIKAAIENRINDISEDTKNYPLYTKINKFRGKNRAFVKIQEGCNNHCTYCIIPRLRGHGRDKSKHLILEEIKGLINSGFEEIVLCGTDIGSYKHLKGLLREIDKSNLSARIRISSIEPMYVDRELIDIITSGNFARHLHMPLQSGSDKILRLMARNYKCRDYERIVDYASKKGIFVGTDIIVGFYGEDRSAFEETYNFVESLPLAYGHIFSYSKRDYTPAVNLKIGLERGPIVAGRNRLLKELFKDKLKHRMKNFIGHTTDIVVEDTQVKINNKTFYKAIASEYFPVLVKDKVKRSVFEIKKFDGEYAYI